MLTICGICLRSDVNLFKLNEELQSFYEDLCNFNDIHGSKFCAICIYKLKKGFEFKKNCILACQKLKTWKRQKVKTPMDLLYKEIPGHLDVCNKDNSKVYHFQDKTLFFKLDATPTEVITYTEENLKVLSPIHQVQYTNEFDDSLYVKEEIDIENTDFKEEISALFSGCEENTSIEGCVIENDTTHEISVMKNDTAHEISFIKNDTTHEISVMKNDAAHEISFIKNDTTHEISVMENVTTKEESFIENDTTYEISVIGNDTTHEISVMGNDATKVEENDTTKNDSKIIDNSENSDDNHQELSDSDSDESLKELILKIKEKKLVIDDKKNRVVRKKNKKFDIDDLRCIMKDKFEKHGEVKDDKGNIIDPKIVLNNLDKNSDHNLFILKKLCLGPGPFKPNVIQRLSRMQDRFKAYEEVFEMIFLSDEKQMAEEFENRRKYPDYLEHEHRCEKCLTGFRHAKTLENHIRTKHNESLPYSCKFCQIHFKASTKVQAHIMSDHSMVYKCKLCPNFITNCRCYMLSHYAKHAGLKSVCKHCDKEFHTRSSLYKHINSEHGATHICQLCAATFHSAMGLNFHKARRHEGEEFKESPENTRCDECNIVFINNIAYNKHMRVAHDAPIQHKDYVPRKRRKITANTNTTARVHACRLCDWKGPSRLARVHHHNQAHPKEDLQFVYGARRYLCHSCGKGYNDKGSYNYHMNKHTNTRPFACPKCPKRFHSTNNLWVHMQRHLPPTYKCESCEKMFTTSIGLRSHMRSHIGDRRYKCEICGKGFLYPGALREHVNGVHLQIRRKRKQCALEDNS